MQKRSLKTWNRLLAVFHQYGRKKKGNVLLATERRNSLSKPDSTSFLPQVNDPLIRNGLPLATQGGKL